MKMDPHKIYIKKITKKHINMGWHKWVNSPNIKKILNTGETFTKRQLLDSVKKSNSPTSKMFAVHENKSDKYFGNIRLTMIDKKHKHCNYGRLIGEKI